MLRIRIWYGALTFASFSAFWASVGFLLARPPDAWNNAAIGAFALIGVIGALVAKVAGALADRGLAQVATGGFLGVMAVSYVALAIGGHSVVALGIGVALMDLGCQGTHISNQSLIYPLRPNARSRLNTACMTSYFVAGALGSGLSAVVVYPHFGWGGVCVLGAAFPTVAALLSNSATGGQRVRVARKACQAGVGMLRAGPLRCLESRMSTASGVGATSTQASHLSQ